MPKRRDTDLFVPVDVGYPDHPKVVRAGEDAGWLNVKAWCYSKRVLSDGLVPKAVTGRLVEWPAKRTAAAVAALVREGLWHIEGADYRIHDYLDWNPSAEQVEAIREQRAIAGRKGGLAKTKQTGADPPNKTEANGEAKGQANNQAKTKQTEAREQRTEVSTAAAARQRPDPRGVDPDDAAAATRRETATRIGLVYAAEQERRGKPPVSADVRRLAQQADALLAEGHPEQRIQEAAVIVAREGKQPGSLPFVLSDVLTHVAGGR